MDIIAASRGLTTEHAVRPVGAPGVVLNVGLAERAGRLQRYYDYQFPSSYLVRPAMPSRLEPVYRPLSVSGAAGELATGYWYPRADAQDDAAIEQATVAHLLGALPHRAAAPWVLAREQRRVRDLLADAAALGLTGAARIDHVYLMERVRRWSSAAYPVGMVVPFLAPDVVAATFALSYRQKRARSLHAELIDRFVPEWRDVPFVQNGTGPSSAARIWDGDGADVLGRLHADSAPDGLVSMLRSRSVRRAVAGCANGTPEAGQQQVLTQFAALAVASGTLTWTALPVAAPPVRWRARLAPACRLARRAVARTISGARRG